jgi:hypothetical protein
MMKDQLASSYYGPVNLSIPLERKRDHLNKVQNEKPTQEQLAENVLCYVCFKRLVESKSRSSATKDLV